MVSILPAKRTPWDVIGESLGKFGQHLPEMMMREYQQKQLKNVFDRINPEDPLEEQLRSILPALSMQGGPQAYGAYQKGLQNQEKNKQYSDIFNGLFGNQGGGPGQGNQGGMQADQGRELGGQGGAPGVGDQQNAQQNGLQGGQKLPDNWEEALARLSIVDPQRANSLRQIMQFRSQQQADKQKLDLNVLSNAQFSKGYQAIQDDDMDTLNDIIKDPNTPYDVKKGLSGLKNQRDLRQDVRGRETRTRQNYLKSAYTRAIDNEKKLLESARAKDKPEIRKRIENLIKLQKKDMKTFTDDPESYSKLSIWNNEAAEYLPEEEFEEEESHAGRSSRGKKVQFNAQNPEHKARATELYKKFGNKEDVRKELAKEFEGL